MVEVHEHGLRSNQLQERENLENGVSRESDVFKRRDHEEGSAWDLRVPEFLDPAGWGFPEL